MNYVRNSFCHTSTVENYFSILKRGITGVYHHVSARRAAEFDFRYANRSVLGLNDEARAAKLLKGIVGKRLTYRRLPDPFESVNLGRWLGGMS